MIITRQPVSRKRFLTASRSLAPAPRRVSEIWRCRPGALRRVPVRVAQCLRTSGRRRRARPTGAACPQGRKARVASLCEYTAECWGWGLAAEAVRGDAAAGRHPFLSPCPRPGLSPAPPAPPGPSVPTAGPALALAVRPRARGTLPSDAQAPQSASAGTIHAPVCLRQLTHRN